MTYQISSGTRLTVAKVTLDVQYKYKTKPLNLNL